MAKLVLRRWNYARCGNASSNPTPWQNRAFGYEHEHGDAVYAELARSLMTGRWAIRSGTYGFHLAASPRG